jgi:hypothetical protein
MELGSTLAHTNSDHAEGADRKAEEWTTEDTTAGGGG